MREIKFEKVVENKRDVWFLISEYENGILKTSVGDWNKKRLLKENGYPLNTKFRKVKD